MAGHTHQKFPIRLPVLDHRLAQALILSNGTDGRTAAVFRANLLCHLAVGPAHILEAAAADFPIYQTSPGKEIHMKSVITTNSHQLRITNHAGKQALFRAGSVQGKDMLPGQPAHR